MDENKQPTDGQILRDWLASVPFGEYNKMKDRLVSVCMIDRSKLANWLYDRARIPALHKTAINAVTREVSGIEIFPIATPEATAEGANG